METNRRSAGGSRVTDAQIQTIMAKASGDANLLKQCQEALNGDNAARTALAALLPVFVG